MSDEEEKARGIVRFVMEEKQRIGWRFKDGAEDRCCEVAERALRMNNPVPVIASAIDAERRADDWEVT